MLAPKRKKRPTFRKRRIAPIGEREIIVSEGEESLICQTTGEF